MCPVGEMGKYATAAGTMGDVLIRRQNQRALRIGRSGDTAVELEERQTSRISKVVFDSITVFYERLWDLQGRCGRLIRSFYQAIIVCGGEAPPSEFREHLVRIGWFETLK